MNRTFSTLAEGYKDFSAKASEPDTKTAFYSGAIAAMAILITGTNKERDALCDEALKALAG